MGTYRIDELAQHAGTTVRKVRAYQDKKVLPPPTRHGRHALYLDRHLHVLRAISRMLDRGYSIANIAELLRARDRGDDVSDLLGLPRVRRHRSERHDSLVMTATDIAHAFGAVEDHILIAELVDIGLVVPVRDQYRVPDPGLLHATPDVVTAGVPAASIARLQMRRSLRGSDVQVKF